MHGVRWIVFLFFQFLVFFFVPFLFLSLTALEATDA